MNETAEQYYGIPDWGSGFFHASNDGHLVLDPTKHGHAEVDLFNLVNQLKKQGYRTPMHLHFLQMLEYSVTKLIGSFDRAGKEFAYQGTYTPIYPIKVNQLAPVVDTILKAGVHAGIGLEAGSLAELAAVMTVAPENGTIVCNGYKDATYIKLLCAAAQKIRRVFLVIEKYSELTLLADVLETLKPPRLPILGIRARLHTRGTGKWEESGGDFAKFGLTASEIIEACDFLKEKGLLNQLRMLHVHIGSQITHTRKVKSMVEEAGMLYAEMMSMGMPIDIIDFGGGLGVDYDGSRSSGASSINYTMTEYANNIIFHMKDVCQRKGVPEPNVFTESGRAITAYHSLLVVDVFEKHSLFRPMSMPVMDTGTDKLLFDLKDTLDHISIKNLMEYFHDAIHMKEQLHTLFNIGALSLEKKAVGEQIFWNIVRKVTALAVQMENRPEELASLDGLLASKYVTNFSIFRSLPDAWAIHQLFPIAPIHRLNEIPGEAAILADITCDSDGKINEFVDISSTRHTLRFHSLRNEPYFLGIFLTGAYQEAMGNAHNLFGNPDTFFLNVLPDGSVQTQVHMPADQVRDMLKQEGYDPEVFIRKWEKVPEVKQILEGNTYLNRTPTAASQIPTVPITVFYTVPQLDCDRCRAEAGDLLSELPMVTGFEISSEEIRVSVVSADLLPAMESILKEAGFDLKMLDSPRT